MVFSLLLVVPVLVIGYPTLEAFLDSSEKTRRKCWIVVGFQLLPILVLLGGFFCLFIRLQYV